MAPMIRRGFADLPDRQVHYRTAGEGPPLLMIHASPGSSKQLEGKISALARKHRVIAPDTPGNGDSPPLALPAPTIGDYADALVAFLDSMGLDRCDVYGTHTGANICLELSVRAPTRVGRVILDGVGLYPDAERRNLLDNYAKPIEVDLVGTQYLRAFMFCRDQYVFWPWFETGRENRRDGGLPAPQVIHEWVLEVLKALGTYHLGYRAAFAYSVRARLPLVERPVMLIAAENDPLADHTRTAAGLLPGARFHPLPHGAQPGFADAFVAAVEGFLSEG
jgi:pimeloyl-ACP methyl ester carboxylesterase